MNWMSIVGLICILIGTAFSFFGTMKSTEQSKKELTTTINEKNDKIDTINQNNTVLIDQNTILLESNNDITITNKDLLSQNKEMLDKITVYQTDIEKKNIRINELEKGINKKYYKPLNEDLQNEIVDQLLEIKSFVDEIYKGIHFKISFGTLDTNRNTSLICRDMKLIFAKAGYEIQTGKGNSVTIDNNLKNYSVPVFIVNPKYKKVGINICSIFRKYITNLEYVTDADYNEATLKFQFYGVPEFSNTGVITYQE